MTGAASGIGAATARKLMADGWRVACLDRNIAGAEATAGDRGIAVLIDVADEASTAAAFARVGEAFGGLDALVTAAGVIETTPFLDTTVEQFRRLFDINVIGSFLSVREGAKLMQPGSRICIGGQYLQLHGRRLRRHRSLRDQQRCGADDDEELRAGPWRHRHRRERRRPGPYRHIPPSVPTLRI